MEVFGYPIIVNNTAGFYTFISLIVLGALYFMKPKAYKKVIPSLIFLEQSKKRLSLTSFFRKFVKDWLILLQLLILIILSLAALHLSTVIELKKINREVIFVIDASASSQAGNAFSEYKEIARGRIGILNSIIVAKNNPEVLAKQTNPVNALRILTTMSPSESLSNIWDAMMVAGDIGNPKSTIIVLSDFIDTNNRDVITAKNLLEAKGFKVELIDPSDEALINTGIIKAQITGKTATIDVKNFNNYRKEIILNDEQLTLESLSVEQIIVDLQEGINEIEIDSDDDFSPDDKINLIIPRKTDSSILYITNERESFVRSALESIQSVEMKVAEPPIVPIANENLFVLDKVDYDSILPGTLEQIKARVEEGSSVIIVAQENMDYDKLAQLLPVQHHNLLQQQMEILNGATLEKFSDYDFGLSSKYYDATLLRNASIIIAEAADKENSPVIVLTKLNRGTVLYYGILDEYNPFRLSSQYPLFWINSLELLLQKDTTNQVNKKIGEVIYGNNINTPQGNYRDYYLTEYTGVYDVDGKKVSVNLLNAMESDINRKISSTNIQTENFSGKKVEQPLNLVPLLIIIAFLLLFLEIYILKKRGTL